MDVSYILSFLIALLLSLAIIPVLIHYSARLGLVDDPTGNSRKLHSSAMPRSGGLGIIVAAAVALLLLLPIDKSLLTFLMGCLVIICFGLLDDIVELKPAQKLGGQAIGVAIAMTGGMVISDFPLWESCPEWFYHTVTFFFVLGVINGVNFSDGMDGLAAGTTLMALLLLFLLAVESSNTQVASITLAVSAAVLGFLRFNTHPARIFMGDSGSQFLGFVVAWLAITLSQSETTPMTTLMPLLILGIPVMDILQVVPVRIKKKLPLPGPDKEHFHHQIAKFGFYQYEVVAIIYVLQAILLASAYLLRFATDEYIFGFYAAYVAIILSVIYLARVNGWQLRQLKAAPKHRRRNRFFRSLSVVHPYTGKFFGIAVTVLLVFAAIVSRALPTALLYLALAWAVALLAIKLFSGNKWPLALGRLATYSASILLMYGLTTSVSDPATNLMIDGLFVVLVILLALSVRLTRREYFWLTTQDLLVLFFVVLLAPGLPLEFSAGVSPSELILRTCILLYICEYVLARGDRPRSRLTLVSTFALCLLAVQLW